MLIRFLQVFNGDAILISVPNAGGHYHVLIDGGPGKAYHQKSEKYKFVSGDLKKQIAAIRAEGETIDLLILTHVDDDHIGGLLKWFGDDPLATKLVKKVWFNSGRLIAEHFAAKQAASAELDILKKQLDTGISQGVTFETLIDNAGIWDRRLILSGEDRLFNDLFFRFISPGETELGALLGKWEQEAPESLTAPADDYALPLQHFWDNDDFDPDDAVHNGSSLAFILTYKEKNFLFMADAHAGVIIRGLAEFGFDEANPLAAELVKLSHHGSCRNLNRELLNVISSANFVISSDGSKYGLPDKRCLARIIKTKDNPNLIFNYPKKIDEIFQEGDRLTRPFSTCGVEGGYPVKIDEG